MPRTVKTLVTPRLEIAPLTIADAPFILELVNDPAWIRFIGDKNVHSLADAETYLRNGPLAMYHRHGFGLFRVDRRSDGAAVGMCGLIRREGLDDVDIGFAFLEAARGHGYASEAARAVLDYGLDEIGLGRIVAITTIDNDASSRVLEKLGMRFVGTMRLAADSTELKLYEIERAVSSASKAGAGSRGTARSA
jgi:RimJ/RimL family protein N-acetyltransferase